MYKIIFSLFSIFFLSRIYSQNVFDVNKIFYFEGIKYYSHVSVDDSSEKINIDLYDKSFNKIVLTKSIKFDSLFLGSKIKLYNSLILLNDDKGNFYYDIIKNNKIYSNIGDRYNEDLKIGNFNPIISEDGILKIFDIDLKLIDSVNLKTKINSNKNNLWELNGESDVINGNIQFWKLNPITNKPGKYDYIGYLYNFKNKQITKITK